MPPDAPAGPSLALDDLGHGDVAVGDVTLHVVTAGPEDGPLVVLLHGFPEFWYGWRGQIGPLADAGYRVVVPDQRGYNRSDKPRGLSAYSIDALAGDVAGLIEATGRDTAAVVGHDWGAAVAWWLGVTRPDRVERLVPINVPHPVVFQDFLLGDLRQIRRSWYVFFFQVPRVPEALLRARDWWLLVRLMDTANTPDAFTPADFERYREAWSRPGAFTAMVNWYRALLRRGPVEPDDVSVAPPTRLIWGVEDSFLRRSMAPPSVDLCDDGELVFVEDATHWLQHERPDHVASLIREFLDEG